MTQLKARYYQNDGSEGKAQALPEWLFDGVVHEDVLHQVIKAYLANQRQGTAAAKSRGQVKGGARKPWRQKGTGRARAGTIRAAQFTGGGVAFPPIPHSWRERVPRKVRALARRSAFNSRAQGDRVVVVDSLEFDAPKTKKLVEMLGALGAEGKALILTDGAKENVYLSSRNLESVIVRPFGEESAYDILWANFLVIEKAALEGTEPSAMDEAAMESRSRSEPAVRARERAAEEEQAERRKARPGHGGKSRKVLEVEVGAEILPERKVASDAKAGAKARAKAKPKAEAKPETKSDTKAEAAPKEKQAKVAPKKAPPTAASGSELDLSSIKLPNVGDLAAFLAQFDDDSDIKTLKARDSRKTAVAHYDARLAELSGAPKGKKG
jgi:large subunit ribosomal protein L4|tara:strand:- start:1832 stop:2977 length:1146 start_codon:yes stop_codon:yes gene_type:complete